MDLSEKFFVECVCAGIKGEKLTELPVGVDYKKLYKLGSSHSVNVILHFALQDLKGKLPKGYYSHLSRSVERHVVREVQSEADTDTLLALLDDKGFKYMPLKGYELKKLYPEQEMRYASDCDVLIDVKEISEIRKTVLKAGLKAERYDEHHDIFYFDETKSVFELHKMLFVGKIGKYFGVGFEKARKKEGFNSRYELSPEDFYMTMIAHSAYHFVESGGVGIRHLTDIFVFRKSYSLDEEYLDREFEKCGLKKFKDKFEKLEKYFFEGGEGDEFIYKLADFIIASTVLANDGKKAASEIASRSSSKSHAILKAIFPSPDIIRYTYPVAGKAPILLPFFYVVRWLRVLFMTPSRLARLINIKKTKKKDIAEVKYIREGLGINELRR